MPRHNPYANLSEAELKKLVDDDLNAKAEAHQSLMIDKKPASARHTIAPSNVVNSLKGAINRPEIDIAKTELVVIPPPQVEYKTCDIHGKYPINRIDDNGRVAYFSGDGCPTCIAANNSLRSQDKFLATLAASGIPKRFIDCTIHNFVVDDGNEWQAHAVKVAKHYSLHFAKHKEQCNSLIFKGAMGTGKTHLAYAIAKDVISHGFSAKIVDSQEYLDWYHGMSSNSGDRTEAIGKLAKLDLLVMDEVGRTPATKGTADALFRLLNARYLEMTPIILITNLPDVESLKTYITDAGYDRLRQGKHNGIVNFSGESWRGRKKEASV